MSVFKKNGLIIFFTVFISAGSVMYAGDIDQLSKLDEEKHLNLLTDSLKRIPGDSMRLKLNALISEKLYELLVDGELYEYRFDSLKNIGKVYSHDNKFRIVSWNVPLLNGTHKFFAFIQKNPGRDSLCTVYKLNDGFNKNIPRLYEARLTLSDWFGALYYDIIPVKTNRGMVYTLLGLRFNDIYTTKKVVESMYFDKTGVPMFGEPIFNYNNRVQNRIIFEYGVNVIMNLRFDATLKMIIFDHLAPSSALYTNNFKHYGPDFTFDGLKFDDGVWQYIPNVDFHNTQKSPKPKRKIELNLNKK
jgi:hypothetical protein